MKLIKLRCLRLVILFILNGIFFHPIHAASAGEAFYTNPVVPGDHPDPSIIRVGKDYWATSTSSEWGPQFPLLHSTDLVNWEQVGNVFAHRPRWAAGNFWAPEISVYKGRYYVYYVGRKRGGPLAAAVAVADKPEGPYTDYGPLISQPAGSIDPVPCVDENGALYLVWKEDNNSVHQPTPIWAQPLNSDGTKLVGEAKELIRNDTDWEGALVEGPYVLRRGDWFYLFYSGNGCCGEGCNYALGVARSHSLLGPWQKNPANPILAGNGDWKCPGHGSIVTDERGRYWLLYHAYSAQGSVFTGREAMLDEVVFGADDWPTINQGKGPSTQAISPYGVLQKKDGINFYDDFATERLQSGWQWPQNNEPICQFREGHLLLSGHSGHGTNAFAAVLARSATSLDYVATAAIGTGTLRPGASAGLSAFGDANNALGLSVGNEKLILWRRDRGVTTELARTEIPPGPKVYLRLTVNNGFQFHFAASTDGQTWLAQGDDLLGKSLPPWDRSIRLALIVEGNEMAEGEFDSFRIVPTASGMLNSSPGKSQSQTNQAPTVAQEVSDIRADCIQHRRVICGKILQVLPDGLVIDSGYTNLMRPPLNLSWIVSGSVTSQRATNLVEGNQPESVCIGLVFLADLPKKPVPKTYDYVNLTGFPTGYHTYTSVGEVRRTIRQFSTKLANAVQWKLDQTEQQNAPAK